MIPTGAICTERDVIAVSGSESVAFLQGQVSQDVEAVPVGSSAWSLVLQPTGKVDTWLRVHRVGSDEFVLDLDTGHGGAAIARLERFKLRTDVTFEPYTGWSMVAGRGPDATGHGSGARLTAEVSWPGFEGVDHLGPDVVMADRAPSMSVDDFEALRIAAGWPRLGAELTDSTIPAEAGAALVESSVSFTKGCYTGQELVARIDSRGGNVPRPIRVLVGPVGSAMDVGATVGADGDDVGRVTSATRPRPGVAALALAPMSRKIDSGAEVTVGDVGATVSDPPVAL